MATQKKFSSIAQFKVVNMGSVDGFLYQKMLLFGVSFWVSVSALLFTLFGFFNRVFSRFHRNESFKINNSNCLAVPFEERNQPVPSCTGLKDETEVAKPNTLLLELREHDMSEEKESPKLVFKFQFQTQTFEKLSRSFGENNYNFSDDCVPSTSKNKYEFMSVNDSSCIMEKPEDVSFSVRELYADSNDASLENKEIADKDYSSGKDFMQKTSKEDTLHEEISENCAENICEKEAGYKLKANEQREKAVCEQAFDVELPSEDDVSRDFQFLSEQHFNATDSDSDSIASSYEEMSRFVGSTSCDTDGFLSERDFGESFHPDIDREMAGLTEKDMDFEVADFHDMSSRHEEDDFEEEDESIMEELRKLEESNTQNDNPKEDEDSGTIDTSEDPKKSGLDDSSATDSEGLETLWEHQDLIEQLKMELKKVRATGLPTILEESESPKIMEDLKPWKIDEKFHHQDRMGELHKFYKSYRERMRKFDIFNYQKMYAIGFLQSKDPLQSFSSLKSSSPPAISSLLSQNLRLGKRSKSQFDPMTKFITELHGDLEVVYVGQLCLSWEILHWQYEKAIELWESDQYGLRRYNEVAGEFQQFQVLLQRFIENEKFEGPRVQNYVKKRCFLRNLLQVPVIREDGTKDKRKARRKGREDDAITSDMLVEIMEESIRIFWRFVRADKDANVVIQKGRKGTQVEPLDPADLEILAEVQSSLQKKDKKLKDLLRSGNCILRKFKKHQEDNSDQVLSFFSQVDMKLVARVLNMSKVTTDQLLWCHNKLSTINFVNRKIHVEPTFLLFPC